MPSHVMRGSRFDKLLLIDISHSVTEKYKLRQRSTKVRRVNHC